MLKISCPDGELKYPKSVLQSSPYIKNSLLEKHFFGQFSQANEVFLQFSIDIVKGLIPFIRSGVLKKPLKQTFKELYYDLFRYLSMENPDSYFYIVCLMFDHNLMDITGLERNVDLQKEVDIKKIPYWTYYEEEAAKKRQEIAHKVIARIMGPYFESSHNVKITDLIQIMETDDNQIKFTIDLIITRYDKYGYDKYKEDEKYDLRNFLALIHDDDINEKVKEIQRQIYDELTAYY